MVIVVQTRKKIGSQIWSWVVVGAVIVLGLGTGVAFTTSGHPWIADACYVFSAVLFVAKFFTWEDIRQQQPTRRRRANSLAAAAATVTLILTIAGNHYLNHTAPTEAAASVKQSSQGANSPNTNVIGNNNTVTIAPGQAEKPKENRAARAPIAPGFQIGYGTSAILDGIADYGATKERYTFIVLPTTVYNEGAPSVIRNIRMFVKFFDGAQLEGEAYLPKNETITIPGPKGPISFPRSSCLFQTGTEKRIETGGQADGFIMFKFPPGLMEKIADSGEVLTVQIADYKMRWYTVQIPRSKNKAGEFGMTPKMFSH